MNPMGRTRGPAVHCGAWTPTDRFEVLGSPQAVPMSEGASTLGKRVRCAPFHGSYYYRVELKNRKSRGWAR